MGEDEVELWEIYKNDQGSHIRDKRGSYVAYDVQGSVKNLEAIIFRHNQKIEELKAEIERLHKRTNEISEWVDCKYVKNSKHVATCWNRKIRYTVSSVNFCL